MKLSIIIPCYNVENLIQRSVDSILKQKTNDIDLEILLCNDGSKDNTLHVLEEIRENHPLVVRVLSHPNKGVYKTRNDALDIVEGDYIWLIDSDDTIAEGTLEKIIQSLNQYTPQILTFGYRIENANGLFTEHYPPKLNYPTPGIDYLKNNDGRLFLWFNVYQRDFINNNDLRFLGKSMSLEDSFFNIQAYTYAQEVQALNALVYNYHFNESSISKKPSLDNRLKQGESSMNVHIALQDFRDSYKHDEKIYKVIDAKLRLSILGFFYSLLKERYPINYIENAYQKYQTWNLIPIRDNSQLNFKAKAFSKVANRKQIFLLLSKLNLMRK